MEVLLFSALLMPHELGEADGCPREARVWHCPEEELKWLYVKLPRDVGSGV